MSEELVQVDKKDLTTLRRVLTATMLSFAITVTSGVFYVYQDLRGDADQCQDDAERNEANRRLWFGIFNRAEEGGADPEELKPYRDLVQDELPEINC